MRHVLIATMFLLSSCYLFAERRRPERYVLPAGYVGWVKITFNVAGATPLPLEEGHDLYLIPASGHLITSSHFETGWAKDQFFYGRPDGFRVELPDTGWGNGGMIWAESNGPRGDDSTPKLETFRRFFVGSEQRYKCYEQISEEEAKRGIRQPDEPRLAFLPAQCR
jgi:hypothetical protein